MIGTFSTAGFTREAWIEKRVAEGFTKEQAEHEFDSYTDPAIAKAQEQKVPTRGEMIQMINEAIMATIDKEQIYKPNFTLTAEYMALSRESKSALKNNDVKRAQELSQRMLSIQLGNLISKEERQEEVDKTLVMPISEIFKEFNKYKAIMAECAEKIDNFDISSVQAKVDEVTEKYEKKAEGKSGIHLAQIKASYEKEVNDLEYKLIKIPMNDLKIKRYRASEFLLIYEARIEYYMTANKDLIEEEIQNAKREEIRGSLGDLVAYMEEA